MSPEKITVIIVGAVVLLTILAVLFKLTPKRLKTKRYVKGWQELQAKCSDPTKWPEVLKEADELLDDALRKRKIKGKTTGERMVSAQKIFTNNDSVWFGHKLYKKYQTNPELPLTQEQMKKALLGLRQGLIDLGALK